MSESRRKVLISVFGKLKQRVIWKWETESMEDKPDNLLLSSWLPQQDILAHPNTLLFISHLGQSSAQETLCHQTPVVRNIFYSCKILLASFQLSLGVRTTTHFFQTQNFFGPKILADQRFFQTHNFISHKIFCRRNFFLPKFFGPIIFWGYSICLGLGDFHWRRGIKPFQAEHFRLEPCSFYFQSLSIIINARAYNKY